MIQSKFFVLMVLASLFAVGARAEDVRAQSETQLTNPLVKQKRTSAMNRENESFLIAIQPVGFGPIPEFSTGLDFGLFLSPDTILQLELSYTSGSPFSDSYYYGSSSSYSVSHSHTDMQGLAAGVQLKQFVANSFYVKGGLDYRVVHRNYNYVDNYSANQSYSAGFSGNALSASFALGNQWQFAHFTLGCDWAGISVPFLHSVTEETASTSNLADGNYTRSDGESRYLSMTSLELLRFYLGASF